MDTHFPVLYNADFISWHNGYCLKREPQHICTSETGLSETGNEL